MNRIALTMAFVIGLSSTSWLRPSIASAATLAGGSRFTVVVKPDGTVWTWGQNNEGQLGDGTQTERWFPAQVPGLTDVVAVAAGSFFALALKSDGTLYAWGINTVGQLGDGTTTRRLSPVLLSLTDVVAIAAGADHAIAKKSDGSVWVWGYNASGQLGLGHTSNVTSPTSASGFGTASVIAAGFYHTLVVRTDGTVRGAGSNGNGQLGDNSTSNRSSPVAMSGISTAVAAAGGFQHSLMLLADGTVRGCGKNFYGEVGNNSTLQQVTPVAVSSLTNVTAIQAVGWYGSRARRDDGTAWGWGYNSDGEIGDGTTTHRSVPTQTTTSTGMTTVSAMATGHVHTVAVDGDGVVWSWGFNERGAIGDGTTVTRITPVAISGPDYEFRTATPIFSVAPGTYENNRTVVVTNTMPAVTIHYTLDGAEPTEADPTVASGGSVLIDRTRTLKAKAWKTGLPPSATASATYTMVVAQAFPSPSGSTYTAPVSVTIATVTASATIRYTLDGSTPDNTSPLYTGAFTIGTTSTLRTRAFRDGWTPSTVVVANYPMNFGTLAAPTFSHPTGTYTSAVTVTISSIAGATIRYTTNGSTPNTSSPIYTDPLAIATTQTLNARAFHPDYVASGTTGATYTIQVATPVFSPTGGPQPADTPITISTATPGATITYTLTGADPTQSATPILSGATIIAGNFVLKARAWKTGCTPSTVTIGTFSVTGGTTAAQIDANGSRSAALRPDGTVWIWGQAAGDQGLPTRVPGMTGAHTIAIGDFHLLARRADGTVWAWGTNTHGQIGVGNTTDQPNALQVPSLADIIAIAAGQEHSLAVHADGTVSAWGKNASGQLGDGTTTQRTSPVTVSGLTNVIAVSAGNDFSIALKGDGTVWSWGANTNGELGDGTTTPRTTPVQVSGLTGVTAIAAGSAHTLALKSDGTVVAWGFNGQGCLGDGTLTPRTTPVAVSPLSNIVAIAAGNAHSLAVTTTGNVWGFGSNAIAELGVGNGLPQTALVPIALPTFAQVTQIAAGSVHSLALDVDRMVWAWGDNFYAQHGDGTTVWHPSPTAVSGEDMAWRVGAPTLSVGSGIYSVAQSVLVTCRELDELPTLHYTTTGIDPAESDPTLTCGSTFPIDVSTTFRVSGWRPGAPTSVVTSATYTLKAVTPTLLPGTGTYGTPQTITTSTTTSGATLRYTLDGTTPIESSPAVPSPFTPAGAVTLRVRAFKAGWTASDITQASYWISEGAVGAPVATPTAGTYTSAPWVSLTSATSGATIRYSTDGSPPTLRSPVYRFAFFAPVTTTIMAQAFKPGFTPSAVTTVTYAVDAAGSVATPTITPAGGTFTTYQTVTIAGSAGATLHYTTSGVDPTEADPTIVSGATIVVDRSLSLKVRAWQTGLAASAVQRTDYRITGALAAGGAHSLALKADGTLWAWGLNDAGQLGVGGGPNRLTPVQVSTLTDVVAIAGGATHSLAVKRDGTVWAWGANDRNQLGDGSTTWRNSPWQVPGLTGVIAVAAGTWHSLALKADGTVWAWGNGWEGQVGDNTGQIRTTPVQVMGLTRAVRIAASTFSSYAIEGGGEAGVLWAWGANSSGQLGDGSLTSRVAPIRVAGLSAVSHIASANGEWAAAILDDGGVRLWGRNAEYQLAEASAQAAQPFPCASPLLRDAAAIAVGGAHGFLIGRADGRVWAWGTNTFGQTGENSYPNGFATPHPLLEIVGWTAAGLGGAHSLIADASGAVWVMGANTVGQLGDGSTTNRNAAYKLAGLTLADNTWLLSDPDGDGLSTWREFLAHTDPLNPDSNGNGIPDGAELDAGRVADDPDADGDGSPNWEEALRGTDPFKADSDGDGVNDRLDIFPLDPTRSALPPPDPNDHTPPVITVIEPTNAIPVP